MKGRGGRWQRWILALMLLVATAAAVPWLLVGAIGGAWSKNPVDLHTQLSPAARDLVAASVVGIDSTRRLDHHVHLAGLGTGGTGAWVNPRMTSWAHPVLRHKTAVYLSAAGVRDMALADQQYLARLLDVAKHISGRGRLLLLAFDWRYRPDGTRDQDGSEFHVPNDLVLQLARDHKDVFVPAGSVHPYRKDALAELDRLAAAGVHAVKWLPNAQGIDPADPRCVPYYERMRTYGMALLTHTGKELAVEAEADQDLGNPLRLRLPLDHGVRVIAAHMASLGDDVDLDATPGPDGSRPREPSWRLLLRLFDEPRYVGLLYGEVSAMTMFSRSGEPLLAVLSRPDLHARLVDGSDYPLPAINALYPTRLLARRGYLSDTEAASLREIYQYNPLLFDFVLKRTVKHPQTGVRLPPEVFHDRLELIARPVR